MSGQNKPIQMQIVAEDTGRARPVQTVKVDKNAGGIISERCPRCHGIMLNDSGEPWCLNCGPIPVPLTVRQNNNSQGEQSQQDSKRLGWSAN